MPPPAPDRAVTRPSARCIAPAEGWRWTADRPAGAAPPCGARPHRPRLSRAARPKGSRSTLSLPLEDEAPHPSLTLPPSSPPTPQSVRVSAAANRPVWIPGAKAPAHLNGSLPGDRGFDPLSLGTDAGRLKWYAEAERQNARWAMIGVAGILGQELLGVSPKWFMHGTVDYGKPILALVAIQQVLFGAIETTRYANYKTGEKNALFPLDPAGLNSEANAVKEIKNGRLAMVAFIGFAVQAIVSFGFCVVGREKIGGGRGLSPFFFFPSSSALLCL